MLLRDQWFSQSLLLGLEGITSSEEVVLLSTWCYLLLSLCEEWLRVLLLLVLIMILRSHLV